MQTQRSKKNIGIVISSIGIVILLTSFIIYPSFLPRIITHENSVWIDLIGYIFYALLFGSLILTAFGINKTFHKWDYRTSIPPSSSSPPQSFNRVPPFPHSLYKIIIKIVNDKKYFRFFWPTSIGYGFFYAVVSSMFIYRPDNISDIYGVSIPSLVITSYGPVGYVPTIAAYFTEHIGLLIIPINLIITVVVSALVGFNTVISLYAFANRPKNKKSSTTTAATSSGSILGALGVTTSLFAACPTCASFYIFSIMAGSLAPTIAAFAVTYYVLFVVVSIPLLLATPFITALSIRRMMFGQCSLDNKKRSNPANNVG
jgi:hypothetical protein